MAKYFHFSNFFDSIGQSFERLISNWQNFTRNLANFYAIGEIFSAVNDQILKNNEAIWSHWLRRQLKQKNLLDIKLLLKFWSLNLTLDG